MTLGNVLVGMNYFPNLILIPTLNEKPEKSISAFLAFLIQGLDGLCSDTVNEG